MLGHNLPLESVDPLRDRLAEDYDALTTRTSELCVGASRVPNEFDDETVRKATDFVAKQLKSHRKALDEARTREKEPFLSGGRTVDDFFNSMLDQMENAISSVELKIDAHLKATDLARTHGAHGGIATLQQKMAFEITDHRAACSLLWRYIDGVTVAKAARAYLRDRDAAFRAEVAKGDVHVSGVRFFLSEKAIVR